jgi:hypothetical protein
VPGAETADQGYAGDGRWIDGHQSLAALVGCMGTPQARATLQVERHRREEVFVQVAATW